MSRKSVTIIFVNQGDDTFKITIPTLNQRDNLMEIIRDYGYQDWGECRGRAWCRSCHIATSKRINQPIDGDEEDALEKLADRHKYSRLACQININEKLDGCIFYFLGDH